MDAPSAHVRKPDPAVFGVLGPEITLEKHGARRIIELSLNETASYVPEAFYKQVDAKKPIEGIIHSLKCTNKEEELVQYTFLVRKDIYNHFEMRLQLLLQQLELVYASHIKIMISDTEAQAGVKNKKSDKTDAEKGEKFSSDFAEAHCSTISSMQYTTQEDEVAFLQDPEHNPEIRILAKDTPLFNSWNMVTKFFVFINQIDSLLDEQFKNLFHFKGTFRSYIIYMLNHCADKKLTPVEAFRHILVQLTKHLKEIETVKKNELPRYKKVVLGCYLDVVEMYQDIINSPRNILKLNFQYSTTNRQQSLKSTNDLSAYFIEKGIRLRSIVEIDHKIQTLIKKFTTSFEEEVKDNDENVNMNNLMSLTKCALIKIAQLSPHHQNFIEFSNVFNSYSKTQLMYVKDLLEDGSAIKTLKEFVKKGKDLNEFFAQLKVDVDDDESETDTDLDWTTKVKKLDITKSISEHINRIKGKSCRDISQVVVRALEEVMTTCEVSNSAMKTLFRYFCINQAWYDAFLTHRPQSVQQIRQVTYSSECIKQANQIIKLIRQRELL